MLEKFKEKFPKIAKHIEFAELETELSSKTLLNRSSFIGNECTL